jgi:hypothetical protein
MICASSDLVFLWQIKFKFSRIYALRLKAKPEKKQVFNDRCSMAKTPNY